jgi:integrase
VSSKCLGRSAQASCSGRPPMLAIASSVADNGRAWHRALRSIDHPTLRVYDCRHAAATSWLEAGVPLGEAARRLGHSVDTLVSTYVGALSGHEEIANARIEAFLDGSGG